MALFAPGALAGPISGTVGGVNFAHGPAGPYIRRTAIRTSSATPAQLRHRAIIPAARAAWAALTAAKRLGWERAAARIPNTNRLGLQSPMAGYQLYVRFFVQSRHAGQPTPGIPPVALTQAPITAATLYLAAPAVCIATVTAPNLTYFWTWDLFMARPCTTRPRTSAQHWRKVTTQTTVGAPVDVTAAFLAVFSPPRSGERWLARWRTGGAFIMPSAFFSTVHTATG